MEVDLYQSRVGRLFLSKFYHDEASTNFLKHLIYLGEVKPENSKNELQYPNIGRKYSFKKTDFSLHKFQSTDIDCLFLDKYFKSMGLTVSGFQFLLPNLSNLLKRFFLPSANLINTESGTEEITVPTQHSFYPEQEAIEKNIKKYKDVAIFYFINKSYFLYDKIDLIKETFITALQKKY